MDKPVSILLLLMLLFLGACQQKGSTQINNRPNSAQLSVVNKDSSIFENLSTQGKKKFIDVNKSLISPIVLAHYDNYSKIRNVDSIFSIVNACKTENIKIIPFYFYVVLTLSENSDGYVGESINDFVFNVYHAYPEYVYRYASYLKLKGDDNGYKGLLFKLIYVIDGLGIDNKSLDSM